MANKKHLIVGNWKMHLTVAEASLLHHRLDKAIAEPARTDIVLCPSYIALQPLVMELNRKKFKLGVQNLYHKDEGAVTGEISAAMIRDLVDYAIIGHSERRTLFGEPDSEIALKVSACLRHGIRPILCVGETLVERHNRETELVIRDQIVSGLNLLTAEDVADSVITYEPAWAVSNGSDFDKHILPTPEEVTKAVEIVRNTVQHLHDGKTADQVQVLYGGSAHLSIATGYLRIKGVDGLLVGGDSLNYEQFAGIVRASEKIK